MARNIILLGRNATHMGHEDDIEVFAGQEIETGKTLLDPRRRRAYQIVAKTLKSIGIRELFVTPRQVHAPEPLDDARAVGNLVENGARTVARKNRKTGRWERF